MPVCVFVCVCVRVRVCVCVCVSACVFAINHVPLSGTVQSIATHPLDTIRTRMSLSRDLGAQYRGIVDCALQVCVRSTRG